MTPTTSQPWSRPSPKLWRQRLVQLALVGVPLLIVAVVIGAVAHGLVGALAGLALAVAANAQAAVLLHRRYLSWGYSERDDDLLVRRGVLLQRLTIVPYGRMQFIDVTAGPFERAFGLATVQLHTAAAASDARIPGLAKEDAARLREQLAQLGESRAMGL